MSVKRICIALACCGVATMSFAAESGKGKEKAQPMSEPNPVRAYVNVVPQGGEGKSSNFMLCQHSDKGCEKPVHTKKHLAVSNPTVKVQVGTAKENNNLADY